MSEEMIETVCNQLKGIKGRPDSQATWKKQGIPSSERISRRERCFMKYAQQEQHQ